MRCPIVQRNSEESHLAGAFSADGGRSWTPVEMAMRYGGPLIIVAGIVETEIDGQKTFLLPAHRNTLQKDPLGSRDHFILSSTSLLEWKLEASIPQPTSGKVFLHEGHIAPGDTTGELKIVMRTANYENDRLTTDPPRAYSSISRDGGRTWSEARGSRNCTTPSPKRTSVALRTVRTSMSTTTAPHNATKHLASPAVVAWRLRYKTSRPEVPGARKELSTMRASRTPTQLLSKLNQESSVASGTAAPPTRPELIFTLESSPSIHDTY